VRANGPGKRECARGNLSKAKGFRVKGSFQKLYNFLGFRVKQILIQFKQRFKSFLEIKTWN
jgi:hypothetical protein